MKRGGNSAALTFSSSCIEGGEKDVTWTYVKKRAERRVRREATIVNDLLHLEVTLCDAQRLSKVAKSFCNFRPNDQPAREKKHVMATGIKYCTSNQDALVHSQLLGNEAKTRRQLWRYRSPSQCGIS